MQNSRTASHQIKNEPKRQLSIDGTLLFLQQNLSLSVPNRWIIQPNLIVVFIRAAAKLDVQSRPSHGDTHSHVVRDPIPSLGPVNPIRVPIQMLSWLPYPSAGGIPSLHLGRAVVYKLWYGEFNISKPASGYTNAKIVYSRIGFSTNNIECSMLIEY